MADRVHRHQKQEKAAQNLSRACHQNIKSVTVWVGNVMQSAANTQPNIQFRSYKTGVI
jgi:hypothetical protein